MEVVAEVDPDRDALQFDHGTGESQVLKRIAAARRGLAEMQKRRSEIEE